jgi:hypothetical protein
MSGDNIVWGTLTGGFETIRQSTAAILESIVRTFVGLGD